MKEQLLLNGKEIKLSDKTNIYFDKGKMNIEIVSTPLLVDVSYHNGFCYRDFKTDAIRLLLRVSFETNRVEKIIETSSGYDDFIAVYGFERGCTQAGFEGNIKIKDSQFILEGVLYDYGEENKTSIKVVQLFEPGEVYPTRKIYTSLEEVKNVNPEDVYILNIEEGTYNVFPPQILTFKNLESLTFQLYAYCEFREIPKEINQLKQLRTLCIFQAGGGYPSSPNGLKKIPHEIGALSNLEELRIEEGLLEYVPESIGDLTRLQEISFSNNKLTTLPKSIGNLPNIKSLNIEYNTFKTLPKSLKNIQNIKIKQKYRKLYKDTTYISNNKQSIDESLFNLSRYPKLQKQLNEAIDSIEELIPSKQTIIDCSGLAVYAIPIRQEKKLPIGVSKQGGAPDLPKEISYPTDESGRLYIFHAQINLSEIAALQNYLPQKGMLYFFVSDEDQLKDVKIIYTEALLGNLEPYIFLPNAEFIDLNFNIEEPYIYEESQLEFTQGISLLIQENATFERLDEQQQELLIENDNYDLLFDLEELIKPNMNSGKSIHTINGDVYTQNESPSELAASKIGGEPSEWINLLCLKSIIWGEGTLTYSIHKKDLAIANFSKAFASIESS